MKWVEFANKINGEYEDNSIGFIGGDTILKLIKKDDREEQIKIQKKIRRSFGASSHFNVEKFEIECLMKNRDFGKSRITRKNIFGRIGRQIQNHFTIEEETSNCLLDILSLKELQYLLKYPKSEFIILNNIVKFKSQSLGEMKEELDKIFYSFEILKIEMNTAANKR